MSPKIFMTGASGYIGGQFLHNLSLKHPDYQIVALVRTQEKADAVKKLQPAASFVIGDLDSSDIITEESSKADVVLQLAECDHVGATMSIMQGIVKGGRKGVFIHISGAANIFEPEIPFGAKGHKVWSDVHDLAEIKSFDDTHYHNATERIFFNAPKTHGIKSAIVAPSEIYGVADGIKKQSMGVPWLFEAIIKHGKAFTVNEGKCIRSASHVKDVADVFVMLVEEALTPEGTKLTWGEDAYHFVESDGYALDEMAGAMGKLLAKKGLIGSEIVEPISPDQVTTLHPWGALLWGRNMRVRADRLRGLGWVPKQPWVYDCLEEMLPKH